MLPTPEIRFWSSSSRLMPAAAAAHPAHERRRRRTPGRAGRGRCGRSRAAARRRPAETDEAAEHPLVDEAQLAALVGARRAPSRTRRCRSSGAPGGCTSSWPLIPRWPSSASPLSSGARGTCRGGGRPRSGGRSARRRSRPGRAGRGGPGGGGGRRREVIGARRRRGARGRRGRPRPRGARARRRPGQSEAGGAAAACTAGSSTPRSAAISPYAVSAAACSASFLERPTPLP